MANRKIRVLPDDVANQIAAGEVVERPASVVKELVENAVDAGAMRIVVELGNAGRSFIRVTDDGEGMEREDALLALERHATSKVLAATDLLHIETLGFRGEALPSIVSVSRVRLLSRPEQEPMGTLVQVEGGKIIAVEEVGAARGTEIVVKDLFFNIPARRKFLKSDPTELRNCVVTVTQLALVHHDVSFELSTENRKLLAVPAGQSLEERAADLVGAEVGGSLHWYSSQSEEREIDFCFGAPHEGRGQRHGLRFFVNGRAVQDRLLLRATMEGYRGLLETHRYPVALLWLRVPPEDVDVNVHPAKREVRFRDERKIFGWVSASVSEALSRSPWLSPHANRGCVAAPRPIAPSTGKQPSFQLSRGVAEEQVGRVAEALERYAAKDVHADKGERTYSWRSKTAGAWQFQSGKELGSQKRFPVSQIPTVPASAWTEDTELPPHSVERGPFDNLELLGAFDATYLIFEDTEAKDLVLMDQHAAHERILYEKLLNAREENETVRQTLLLPVVLDCSAAELAAFEVQRELLDRLGFSVELFGPSSIAISATPSGFNDVGIEPLVRDLLSGEEVYSGDAKGRELVEAALRKAACSAAVKARKALDPSEVSCLLKSLSDLRNPTHCPHGRPLLVRLPRGDVEALFHRA